MLSLRGPEMEERGDRLPPIRQDLVRLSSKTKTMTKNPTFTKTMTKKPYLDKNNDKETLPRQSK